MFHAIPSVTRLFVLHFAVSGDMMQHHTSAAAFLQSDSSRQCDKLKIKRKMRSDRSVGVRKCRVIIRKNKQTNFQFLVPGAKCANVIINHFLILQKK